MQTGYQEITAFRLSWHLLKESKVAIRTVSGISFEICSVNYGNFALQHNPRLCLFFKHRLWLFVLFNFGVCGSPACQNKANRSQWPDQPHFHRLVLADRTQRHDIIPTTHTSREAQTDVKWDAVPNFDEQSIWKWLRWSLREIVLPLPRSR